MRIRKSSQGFSLVELVVTIGIIGVLFFLAIPAWKQWQNRAKIEALTRELMQSVALAREQALASGQIVRLCPLDLSSKNCGNDWRQGWKIDTPDSGKIFAVFHPAANVAIRFDNLRHDNQLLIQPEGVAEGSNGSFLYSHHKLVINRGGRARLE